MLQSRRDVALKDIESCSPVLLDTAQQEMAAIRDNLKTTAVLIWKPTHFKGNIKNISRWMEPSEDVPEYLTAHMQHNRRLALDLSNLRGIDTTTHPDAIDVSSSRQLHSHLCGTLEQIERTLTRWGDLPLPTWAPLDNGQLLIGSACFSNTIRSLPSVPEN